jgi:anionic cell wall polymer biosynthesis LytR-Cps2A-Psr (LCP) family protein
MTNFNGFVSIVDNVGGINVNAALNLTDKCDLPQASYDGYCSAGPGVVSMNGSTALWYVRSRYSSSDFDRTRRGQEVIQALLVKLLSLNAVSRIPDLYNIYQSSVETNINLETVISLAPMAPILVEKDAISRYYIGPQQVSSYTVPESGAAVLLPNQAAIEAVLREALFK